MTLTLDHGPLSGHPPETANYRIDGPAHRLLLHRFPRRVRALLGGEVVLDTRRGQLLHETGHLPQLYVPEADVSFDLLERSDHTSHCPFKGDAVYWTVRNGNRVARNAAWSYPEPLDSVQWLGGLVALYWDSMDEWFDEEEQVDSHLRDPFHRVDVRASSATVRVIAGGQTIAETVRPRVVSETGLPNRWYIPPEDVRREALDPSSTRMICPYKGTASYWSVSTREARIADAAWSYPEPLEGARPIADHLCFAAEGVDVLVDGEPSPPR
jgi:uncharacterized protein (DUF427 family)